MKWTNEVSTAPKHHHTTETNYQWNKMKQLSKMAAEFEMFEKSFKALKLSALWNSYYLFNVEMTLTDGTGFVLVDHLCKTNYRSFGDFLEHDGPIINACPRVCKNESYIMSITLVVTLITIYMWSWQYFTRLVLHVMPTSWFGSYSLVEHDAGFTLGWFQNNPITQKDYGYRFNSLFSQILMFLRWIDVILIPFAKLTLKDPHLHIQYSVTVYAKAMINKILC